MKHFLTFMALLASASAVSSKEVTCGSVVYMNHIDTNANLLISGYNHGSKSGQPLVTGVEVKDHPTMWTVKGAHGTSCPVGQRVKCGSQIRLEHVSGANLHSHPYPSIISRNNYEVSGFGDNGNGDSGDDFIIECQDDSSANAIWKVNSKIALRHKVTRTVLRAGRNDRYSPRTCPQCPFQGHFEISSAHSPRGVSKDMLWKAVDVLIVSNEDFDDDEAGLEDGYERDEL